MTLSKERTYTPKEALDADPNWTIPVKLGRGRMPKGGDEHCRILAGQGYRIRGYEVGAAPVSSSTAPAAPPVVRRVPTTTEKVVQEFVIFFDENNYKAVNEAGKEVGMREVCNSCMVSLVQNHCDNPTILGGMKVKIVPR